MLDGRLCGEKVESCCSRRGLRTDRASKDRIKAFKDHVKASKDHINMQ